MSNAVTQSEYLSGQGVLLLAERNVDGSPKGFRPVGNVSALTLGVESSVYEHKESQSGVRGVDFEQSQQLSVSMNFTMESINHENLAAALYGESTVVAAGSVTDEEVIGYLDLWTRVDNVRISSFVLADRATGLIIYELDKNYRLNADAGSFQVMTNAEQVAAGAASLIADLDELYADYSYDAQEEIRGATSGSAPVFWARFEGLNTAKSDSPVVVDAFKMSMQPLAELALITDEITQATVETKLLSDALRTTGSKYFHMRKG